jgi:hypothetical protein
MELKNHKTLTGIPLEGAAERLDAELPKDAYKAVPGAADLTDIDPNYMRKVLNEVFGLCGVGWGYRYDSADMHTELEERKRASGGSRRVYVATLRRLTFWYKLSDGDGNVITCEIDASGGSDNEVEAYAMKGAITNALGHASSNLGFQESVYLGKRSHKTVGKSAAKAPTAKSVLAPKAAKPAPAPAPTPEPAVAEDPASFVIQVGQRAGQKLGDQERTVIEWYANSMKAAGEQQVRLQNAARSLLASRPNGHKPPEPVAG